MELENSVISKLNSRDKKELEHAVAILVQQGAAEVYLFGSIARGEIDRFADWDFAVRGLPKECYLKALGLLLRYLERETDLINLDEDSPFSRHIKKKRELVRVA